MALIENYTFEKLTKDTIAALDCSAKYRETRKSLKALVIHKPMEYDLPITENNLKTSINVEYDDIDGVRGRVYLVGNIPPRIRNRTDNRHAIFVFVSPNTFRDAYNAMYDLCRCAANLVEENLKTNAGKLIHDNDLVVYGNLPDGKRYRIPLNNLLHRKNLIQIYTKSGAYIGSRYLNKHEILPFLLEAKKMHYHMLTPRKQERLDIFIGQYQALAEESEKHQ